jgi:hypothetical protein
VRRGTCRALGFLGHALECLDQFGTHGVTHGVALFGPVQGRHGCCVASWQPEVVALATPMVVADGIFVLNASMSTTETPAVAARDYRLPLLNLAEPEAIYRLTPGSTRLIGLPVAKALMLSNAVPK